MKPKQIAIALTDVLKTISVANGFNTDAGLRVYRGKLNLDGDKVPCIVIGEEDDLPTSDTNYAKSINNTQNFVLDAYVPCDTDNPNDAAHEVIEDLKKAVFSGVSVTAHGGALAPHVRTVKYIRRHIGPRPEGASFVLGSITIQVTYVENLV